MFAIAICIDPQMNTLRRLALDSDVIITTCIIYSYATYCPPKQYLVVRSSKNPCFETMSVLLANRVFLCRCSHELEAMGLLTAEVDQGTGLILVLHSARERRHKVTPSLIGWAQT